MIDSAVIAPGTLMVELNRRNVQHLEGGIVGEVLVREGALVAAGQPLIRLDDTRVRAGLNVVLDETATDTGFAVKVRWTARQEKRYREL